MTNLTTEEQFEKKVREQIFKDKLRSAKQDHKATTVHLRKVEQHAAKCPESLDWWYAMYLDDMHKQLAREEKEIRKWQFKLDRLRGKIDASQNIEPAEIKQRVHITDIMPGKPASKSFNRVMYKCPLHNEKTASFVVYLDQNSFHCFGCGEGGDVIALYQKLHDVDFVTTLKELNRY